MLIIGNVIALISSIIMVSCGLIKKKKHIIYWQTIQMILFVISNLVLGGITGAIINAIGCFRNILCYKEKLNFNWKAIITIISIVLSLVFNNMGLIGLLPVISTTVYIWLMDIKDVVKFKYLIIFTMIMWSIYDFSIKSYTSVIFDILCIISNVIGIIKVRKK